MRYGVVQFGFAETAGAAGVEGDLVVLLEVGDEHHGNVGECSVGFDLNQDVHAVGVVSIELAINQNQVEFTAAKFSMGVFRTVRLHDFSVEAALDESSNRRMVW